MRHTANLARLSPQSSLSLIIAAQRLIAMSQELQSLSPTKRGTSKLPAKHQFVTDLHDWLAENLVNSVKLGDAATKFKKSPRQIIRILKEATGSGFPEHLTMHRVTLARNHLMHTDASIMDIARRSGFNSREQFIRSFNKAFGWTPLQFRKAWNKASLSREDLIDLCQISERKPVVWLEPEQAANFASFSQKGAPHTLIVANALHEIVELFSIDPSGKRTRIGVLDRGAMMFINRDLEGSNWLVRAPDSNLERIFSTPSDHAAAIISPQLAQPNKKEGRRSESAALSH